MKLQAYERSYYDVRSVDRDILNPQAEARRFEIDRFEAEKILRSMYIHTLY